MKENAQRELEDLKIDRFFATVHHRLMIGLAVGGSTVLVGSIPTMLLDLLPRWADIVMIAGGALTGPTSVHELGVTRKWMEYARERVKAKEREIENRQN